MLHVLQDLEDEVQRPILKSNGQPFKALRPLHSVASSDAEQVSLCRGASCVAPSGPCLARSYLVTFRLTVSQPDRESNGQAYHHQA